jgi:hypothetical protein
MFSRAEGMLPYYTVNYSIVGTLGQPGAYTQLRMPADFSGASIKYFLRSLTREFKYHMTIEQNYLGQNKFSLADVSAGAVHYIQKNIVFAAPNRYYFEVEDSTNIPYRLVFGTTPDISSSLVVSTRVTRGRSPGATNAFVYLDLSGYTGTRLYYFDTSNSLMGYYPNTTSNNNYTTTLVGNDFRLNGSRYPIVNFKFNGAFGSNKFDQSDITNANTQLYFSKDPYSITPFYDTSVSVIGIPGQSGAYTTVTVPLNFLGNLYYVNRASTIARTATYFVKRIFNAYNQPAFAFSTTYDGFYTNQLNLSFTGPNRYYFEYFFDMNNPSANTHVYNLVFGNQIDVSATRYTGTVYKEASFSRGSYRTAVYLDLSGYSGSPLYAYNDVCGNMGYSPPPESPDFSYNVSVSGGVYFLNGTSKLAIDFEASKTYLFIQTDPTNAGFPMIFGKLPDDTTNIVSAI